MKKSHLFILISFVIIGLILIIFSQMDIKIEDPKRDVTQAVIQIIKLKINAYFLKFQKLPTKIEELSDYIEDINLYKDGWGEIIKYEVINSNTIKLYSYGSDKKKGGLFADEDIIREFVIGD